MMMVMRVMVMVMMMVTTTISKEGKQTQIFNPGFLNGMFIINKSRI